MCLTTKIVIESSKGEFVSKCVSDLTVSLEIPRLSLTSPYAMVMYNPDKISVTEGSSFSVTCSIHSKYTDGLFYLRKHNQNITEPKPAFGHALFYVATFDFSAVGYKDQGDYHCIFAVNISSLPFTSAPSKSLQITVSGLTWQRLFLQCLQHCLSLHMLTK